MYSAGTECCVNCRGTSLYLDAPGLLPVRRGTGPMHEGNNDGCYAERLVCHRGDIVKIISGVVKSVAAQNQHQRASSQRETGDTIACSSPSVTDVLSRNPTQQ